MPKKQRIINQKEVVCLVISLGCMGGTCKTVVGVIMLVSGLALLGGAQGMLDGRLGSTVAGAGLALIGLAKLVHHMGMCPSCKDCKDGVCK